MKVSTRGRYSLRMIADIIANQPEIGFVSLRGVSKRQEISVKYLEQLVTPLVRNGLLTSERGKDGGYRCDRDPKEITLAEVLLITDNMKPVACLVEGAAPCAHESTCPTVGMWRAFSKTIEDFFSHITIQDLLNGNFSEG